MDELDIVVMNTREDIIEQDSYITCIKKSMFNLEELFNNGNYPSTPMNHDINKA